MRLRINGKFWTVVGVLGGIGAAAAIILATLFGGGSTDVATVNDILNPETTTTETSTQNKEADGNAAVAGIAAGAGNAEAKKEETQPATEATTEAATEAATEAPAQTQAARQQTQQTQAARQQTQQAAKPAQTQAATQPATTESNSNADEFRGKAGAGNVDVGGEVKDYDSYVNDSINKNEKTGGGAQEAWGGGYVEYVEE